MTFVSVYSKATGRKQAVPEHWLAHPVLGAAFRKTPAARDAEAKKASANNTTPAGDKE